MFYNALFKKIKKVFSYLVLLCVFSSASASQLHDELRLREPNIELVSRLIETLKGSSSINKVIAGKTPLVLAVESHHLAIAMQLIRAGANIHVAIPQASTKIAFNPFNRGRDIRQQGLLTLICAQTPLVAKDIRLISELLTLGIDTNRGDAWPNSLTFSQRKRLFDGCA